VPRRGAESGSRVSGHDPRWAGEPGSAGRANLRRHDGPVTERDHPTHVLAVSGFVTNEQGDVLLVRVVDRGWELLGGQVELGEGLLDALKREVEEETGCI